MGGGHSRVSPVSYDEACRRGEDFAVAGVECTICAGL